jgi:predicted GNAT superfamily acetyltransferase
MPDPARPADSADPAQRADDEAHRAGTGAGAVLRRPAGPAQAGDARAPGAGASADTVLRPLSSQEDYDACMELQRLTWGRRFAEVVPGNVLKISQRVGGVAAGAFGAGGEMLGFIFGLTGARAGSGPGARPQIVHWSHMLAVAPAARDRGLGARLKLYQRELLLPLGVEVVEWTYDPLEARNAHLNLNRLGAEVIEYVPDMYHGEEGSELWEGIGTDRFVVAWRIASPRVAAALAGSAAAAARAAAASYGSAPLAGVGEGEAALPAAPRVRVEISPDIQALKAVEPEPAWEWRRRTRLALPAYMGRGWRVDAFYRDPASGRCFYGLQREEELAAEGRAGGGE